MAAWAEFDLIRRLAGILGAPGDGAGTGIGDDAAVVAPDLVWACDLLVEDVHFRRSTTPPADLGWKALAVNVSDLAAMGAEPVGALVGLTLPQRIEAAEIETVYAGLRECADAHRCPVLGGDVSRGPSLALAVTVLGRTERPVLRSTARPGDVLAVTGALGGSAVGLGVLEGELHLPAALADDPIRRHRRPQPRLAEGRALAGVVRAMMDVSDGVASDAWRIAEASELTVVVDLDELPLDHGVPEAAAALGVPPGAFAACGGEDYELLVAIDPAKLRAAPVPLHPIGRVEAGPAAVRFTGEGARPDLAGWKHERRPRRRRG